MCHKRLSLKQISFITAVISLPILSPHTSWAEPSLGIYPPVIAIKADRNTSITTPITIKNTGTADETLSVSLKQFSDDHTGTGTPIYLYTSDKNNITTKLAQEVALSENGQDVSAITIPGHATKKLQLAIHIPSDGPEEDQYFSVLFSEQPSPSQGENTTTDVTATSYLSLTVGTHVLLSVHDTGTSNAFIQEYSAPKITGGGLVPITTIIGNNGNHFLTPHGTIRITNLFGRQVAAIPLLPTDILANSKRSMLSVSSNDINHTQSVSDKKLQTSAVWSSGFIFGIYDATLTVYTQDDIPPLTKTIRIIGFPFHLAEIIGLFFIILLVIKARARRIRID